MIQSLRLLVAVSTVVALTCAQEPVREAAAEPVKAPQGDAAAPQRTPAPNPRQASGGNTWFAVTNQDLGIFHGQGEAVGIFKFKNPTDKPVDWRNLTGSCQCAKAIVRTGGRTYELSSLQSGHVLVRVTKVPGQPDQTERVQQIAIEPGADGEVEVQLNMNNITGPKSATLDVHTTDPAQPHFKLLFHATGAQMFVMSPTEVNLNKMTWNETREFAVTVTSPIEKEWNITRMGDAGKAFNVAWEKTVNGDRTSWIVKGKYGPVDGDMAGGGLLKFYTDVKGGMAFDVRVLAQVQGPLEVKPGAFLPLGLIRKGNSLKKEIVFEPNDGSALAATSLTFEKTTMSQEFVTASSRQDGNKLIVELSISDQSPTGLLKGDLVVHLNHPLVKEKRIMFNGFVR